MEDVGALRIQVAARHRMFAALTDPSIGVVMNLRNYTSSIYSLGTRSDLWSKTRSGGA